MSRFPRRLAARVAPLHPRRTSVISAAALVSVLALAGCTAGEGASDSSMATEEYSTGGFSTNAVVGSESAPDFAGTGVAEFSADDMAANTDRQVISTGWATITADDPLDAAEDAVRIVESAGGRVDARSEQAPVDGTLGQVSLTLRIPSATFTATLEELKDLGRDISVETSANDVTTQTQDLDARIAVLTTSVDRLLGLLAAAENTADLIEVETALAARQGELDSLQTQRRSLGDQVSMATLTLTLLSEAEAPPRSPDTFWDSLVAGLAAFAGFFTAAFLALGYAVPWLVLFGVVALVLIIARRRRRAKLHQTPTSAPD